MSDAPNLASLRPSADDANHVLRLWREVDRKRHACSALDWAAHGHRHIARLVREMLDAGFALPAPAVLRDELRRSVALCGEAWTPRAPPRVVGLSWDAHAGVGLVHPLEARRSARWDVARRLPFTEDDLAPLLTRAAQRSALTAGVFTTPRFAFTVTAPCPETIAGESMRVAGFLAVLDALAEDAATRATLAAACAVVHPTPDGRLVTSGFAAEKLDAFVREYGRGTLLVREAEAASAHDHAFDAVWKVRHVDDLLGHLETAGLLTPLRRTGPLERLDAAAVTARLDALLDRDAAYEEAARLADEALACGYASSVSLSDRMRPHTALLAAYLRLGETARAEEAAARWSRRLDEHLDLVTVDDVVRSLTAHAAVLHLQCRFAEADWTLRRWWQDEGRARPSPLRLESRIALANTLCRAWVFTAAGDWRATFEQTLRLAAAQVPELVGRTRCELAAGLLFHRALDTARVELTRDPLDAFEGVTRARLVALSADLHRRAGTRWHDPPTERILSLGDAPTPYHALYLLATGCQVDVSPREREARLKGALRGFRRTLRAGEGAAPTLATLVTAVAELAYAAHAVDDAAWGAGVASLREVLAHAGASGYRAHFAAEIEALAEGQAVTVAHRWVDRLHVF